MYCDLLPGSCSLPSLVLICNANVQDKSAQSISSHSSIQARGGLQTPGHERGRGTDFLPLKAMVVLGTFVCVPPAQGQRQILFYRRN